MLGARMKKTGKSDWKFPLINKKLGGKPGGLPVEISGGDSRMRAISIIYQDYLKNPKPDKKMLVLVTGGRDELGYSKSSQAKNNLVKKYGLPKDIVKSLGGVGSTLGNARAVFEFIAKNRKSFGQIKKIEIITNDYHIIRAWIMFVFEAFRLNEGNQSTSRRIKIPDKTIIKIGKILEASLGELTSQPALAKIIKIMSPYLKDAILVKPVIAENIIAGSGFIGKVYSGSIIRNKWVQATRKLENKGTVSFLKGKYG